MPDVTAAQGWAFALVLARVLPLGFGLATLSEELVPRAVALSLSLALAFALGPVAGPVPLPASAAALVLSVLRELCIGGVFALSLSLALLSIGWAVRMSQLRGSSLPVEAFARVYTLCAAWLVLSLGGLRAIVIALAASFQDAALGGAQLGLRTFALGAVQLVVDAFAAALGFGLPLLLAVWLLEASWSLGTRALLPTAQGQSSLVRPLSFFVVAALLLVPTASLAPEAVRTAIAGARALTRALGK